MNMPLATARHDTRIDAVLSGGARGRWTVALADARNIREVGGKARNLCRLVEVGQPVPDGFVVTSAALARFLGEHDLVRPIENACQGLDVRVPASIQSAAERIAALVRHRTVPPAVAADIDKAAAALLANAVVVRSSAVGEDSGHASFAGQLDSILGVKGATAMHRALVDVWASRWSARVLTYQLARSAPLGGMGVVVQRQVDSIISGVLFTVAPDRPADMLVEYCAGLGDALVAGRVTPSRLAIDRSTLCRSTRAGSHVSSDGAPALDERHIRALGTHARQIESAFGSPQDIEWTIDADGRLWIVQARPITVPNGSVRVSPLAPAASAGRPVTWSNANVNENFPQPISPLLYSIARTGYYHYFRNLGIACGVSKARVAAMEDPLRHIIGVQGARMYYNLSSIHGVLRSAPFGDLLATWFNQFVGSEDTETPAFVDDRIRRKGDRARLKPDTTRIAQAAELAVIAAKTAWQYLFVTRRVERFERTVDAFAARTHPDRLATRTRRELLEDFRGFVDIRNNRWTNAGLADAASMICYGALERWLARTCPGGNRTGVHNSLLKALPDLPSGRPALEIWALSRLVRADPRLLDLLDTLPSRDALAAIRRDPAFTQFAQALDGFLEQWGFRCSGELMLTTRSFQEDPAPLLDIIKAYVGQDGESPADHLRAQRAERLRDTAQLAADLRTRRLFRYLPFVHHWHVASLLLRWTQRSVTLRERARLKQALLYSRFRRIVLALGERLVHERRFDRSDDIFFLTADEVDDLVAGAAMFPEHVRPLVAARRQWHADVSATTPPDSLTLPDGEYFSGRSSHPAQRTGGRQDTCVNGTGDIRTTGLMGTGVCGGTTEARAAVLGDVTDTHRLRPGDVLVTKQTDPGWAAVFPLISGLVMERGGMLSHGAIIAREFGIPSVVGVQQATALVPHGARIHVDGDVGLVRLQDTRSAERSAS